jgi:hypothetical protein
MEMRPKGIEAFVFYHLIRQQRKVVDDGWVKNEM